MLYPLKLQPLLQERLWGGNKLTQTFACQARPGMLAGELWAVADHPHGVTTVVNGVLGGLSLQQILQDQGAAVSGINLAGQTFPIMVKILDADQDLSVQVHPCDAYARETEHERGKAELWYIIHAEAGAKIIYGLRPGVTRQDFEQHIDSPAILQCLNSVEVRTGDAFYIPPGLVHALGKGILAAEVQQNSDVTYRIYDYGRRDQTGNLRKLHLDKALQAIDYTCVPPKVNLAKGFRCPYFTVDLVEISTGRVAEQIHGMEIHLCLQGEGEINGVLIKAGEAVILPACLEEVRITGRFTSLRTRLPS
ncbi:MAG TPA: type I phosphomannose isomerase catalytic subunit [Verrucomicrobiae bacterium]|nr:type I phosphomannose isomerase catalytic subunit [Verrucomicrobiae bacterium]